LEAVVASITEIERAKMVTSLAAVIGKEEANVLATALNLDGQLATHEEVHVLSMELRNSMRDLKDENRLVISSEVGALRTEMKAEFASVRAETSTLRSDMNAEFALLRAETGTLRSDMNAEFTSVRAEMKAEFASVRAETSTLRSDMNAEFALVRADTKAEFARMGTEIGLLRTEFTSEVRKQTRQLFVALLTVVATIFGLMAGLLGIAGKL
jgi:hypothetical protein